jgi:hypothetical protein
MLSHRLRFAMRNYRPNTDSYRSMPSDGSALPASFRRVGCEPVHSPVSRSRRSCGAAGDQRETSFLQSWTSLRAARPRAAFAEACTGGLRWRNTSRLNYRQTTNCRAPSFCVQKIWPGSPQPAPDWLCQRPGDGSSSQAALRRGLTSDRLLSAGGGWRMSTTMPAAGVRFRIERTRQEEVPTWRRSTMR